MFGISEIFNIEIVISFYFVFFNVGPNEGESFKTILLQIPTKRFQTYLEFSS